MAIPRINVREIAQDYIDMGYTRQLAWQLAREEYDERIGITATNVQKYAAKQIAEGQSAID